MIGRGATSPWGLLAGPDRSPFPQLSDREPEMRTLIARGLDNTAIARPLFPADKTVRNRVSGILTKLQPHPPRSAARPRSTGDPISRAGSPGHQGA